MSHPTPARPAVRLTFAALAVASAAILGVFGPQSPDATPSTTATTAVTIEVPLDELPAIPRESRGALGETYGPVPHGTTVFDDDVPGVARLDPDLLDALRRAATDAAGEGVHFVVSSGWRSPEYQTRLFREAVTKYGSEEEAVRWVATSDTSAHVSGDAVDIGPTAAMVWLSENGAEYGLCQIYSNEPWHYELRPDSHRHGCPRMYDDPTHDPRMQQ